MRQIKRIVLIILLPILAIAAGVLIYYASYEWSIQRNISRMHKENEEFYLLLDAEGISYQDYTLYEEVFIENGNYYLIFTEGYLYEYEEGELVQGMMLEIESDIYTEYRPDISLRLESPYYILPNLWIAGGGSALGTSSAFFKRAELRRLIIENNTSIEIYSITIKLEGEFCLGKIEF
ncbi:MAG: hypothetical protein JXL85_09170 [Bacilli bacterium]|nr:hypothetical protein [Bacilli bacterium]